MKADITVDGKLKLLPESEAEALAIAVFSCHVDAKQSIDTVLDLSIANGSKEKFKAAFPSTFSNDTSAKAETPAVADATPDSGKAGDRLIPAADNMKRDEVKAHLKAAGVTFAERAGDATLAKLYQANKGEAVGVGVPDEEPAGVSYPEIKTLMVSYIERETPKVGADAAKAAAKELMSGISTKPKLSQFTPDELGQLKAALEAPADDSDDDMFG